MTSTTTGRSSAIGAAGSNPTNGEERLQQAAGTLADQAGRTAEAKASTAMDQLGQALEQVAQAAREAGESLRSQRPELASVAETAADKVTEASQYLREHDAREVVATAEDVARRQPALVIAGGFALGLLAGRLLRSATPTTYGGSSYRPTWHSGSDWYSSGAASGYSDTRGRTGIGSQLSSGSDDPIGGDYASSSPGYSSAPYAEKAAGSADTKRTTGAAGRTAGTTSSAGRRRTSSGASTGDLGADASAFSTSGGTVGQRQSMSESTQGEGS
jgi:ElaB/YqjD/DUF883 family membrane-anchored ribosome-binding protein